MHLRAGMMNNRKVCYDNLRPTYEFTNTLNGITHTALHGGRRLAVAKILMDDSYFTEYSLHCESVSIHYVIYSAYEHACPLV